MDIGRPLLPQQPESPWNRPRLCCVGAEEGLGPATSFILSPHSWAQAPRQACGFAAPTCCCLFLQTQVSLRRLRTAFPSHSQRGSASPHPPRLWAWPGGRASPAGPVCLSVEWRYPALPPLPQRALWTNFGGEVLSFSQRNVRLALETIFSLEVPGCPCPPPGRDSPVPWVGVPGEPPDSPTCRDQLGRLPGSQSDRPSGEHGLCPEPWCLPHGLPGSAPGAAAWAAEPSWDGLLVLCSGQPRPGLSGMVWIWRSFAPWQQLT